MPNYSQTPRTPDERMADIERILYGDVRANAKGMVAQMTELKALVEKLTERDRERILTMRGIAIGLGLTTLLSGTTLYAVVTSLQQIVAALALLP
jgi:hypothetical protein